MKITIELDKETTELFQKPFKKLSKRINDLIGMFEKVDYTVEDTPDIEPNMNIDPKSDIETNPDLETKKNLKTKTSKSSKPKKAKRKSKPQKSVKATILKTIKKNKDGINTKDLQEKTGFTGKQISNNMFHLKKEKKVEKTKEGLFIAL
ncbi:MAG: hypothetical protein P9L91_06560 [Candidatus Zophobacter franzmannii]|nr:hypothetical protein [Candidatus Zophobacter franzmannii]